MQQHIKDATLQLEMLLQTLRSHALFLRSKKIDHLMVDIESIETQIEALVVSIEDLRRTALQTSESEQATIDTLQGYYQSPN